MANWKAPPALKEPYTAWKEELKIWENFTEIPKAKQGGALFLSLPNPSNARDAVLELGAASINTENGVELITKKLDTIYLKDKNILTYQAWKTFINFKRPQNMNMCNYAIEYSKNYTNCKNNGITLPEGVLAIQFLDSANLSDPQHKLALATCNDLKYESMKAQVLKISTDIAIPSSSKLLAPEEIKMESTTLTAEYNEDQD